MSSHAMLSDALEEQHHYGGVYRAVVRDANDPQDLSRLRLSVPQIPLTLTGWAEPCAREATLPSVGARVWVMFEGADPDFPVWMPSNPVVSSTSSGFDPNEDPVVIGLGAAATSTAQISIGKDAVVTAGHPALSIGWRTSASIDDSIAIGDGCTAQGNNDAIAIGNGAKAGQDGSTNDYDVIAIGDGAKAGGTNAIAIGGGSHAGLNALAIDADTYDNFAMGDGALAGVQNTAAALPRQNLALGSGARAGYDNSGAGTTAKATGNIAIGTSTRANLGHDVALGDGAVCTEAHQIMIGTTAEFVEIPGNGIVLHSPDNTRYRVTVSDAGALTVAPA